MLAERARNILATAGAEDTRGDTEFWFALDPSRASTSARGARRVPVKFVYRQSAQYLIPQNVFRLVTDVDPPTDVPGMATVTLDPLGRLIRFDRVLAGRAIAGERPRSFVDRAISRGWT